MRRLKQWVRVADELAGIVILDLIFGTRAGRRFVAACALTAGLAVWALAGLVVAPGPIPIPAVGDGAPPYFHRWQESGENFMVSSVLERGSVKPDEMPQLRRYLASNWEALERTVSITEQRALITAEREPRYRDLRMLANALVARGHIHARSGSGDRAIRDWLAAMRLGRAMAWGVPLRGPTILSLMIGNAIQRGGVKALRAYVPRMSGEQLRFVSGQLALREAEMPSLALALGVEGEQARRMIEQFGKTGQWPEWIHRPPLDMWLPWRESARAEAARELAQRVSAVYEEAVAAVKAGRWPANPPEIEDFGIASSTWGVLWRSHGVELASRYLLAHVQPHVQAAGERLAKCEAEARELEAAVAERLAWE